MELFDKVLAVGAAGLDKAIDLGEISKCKIEITTIEAKLKETYTDMGMELCSRYPEFVQKHFGEYSEKLIEYSKKIEELNNKIDSIKDIQNR